ncbi:MAG: ribosome small subunit-dependent GTPase A [Leptolyngbya sp. SIO4C1]|nr:ribosome small subunit-dependent GTPase A [Leptolyngbya sp. SIO4C1]
MQLETLGWGPFQARSFEALAADGYSAARVGLAEREQYQLYTAEGELPGKLAGKLRHISTAAADLPAVGDWVAIHRQDNGQYATIHQVLPRQSQFVRQAAGTRSVAQVLAANIDTAFLVSGLDQDFNLRRIERYLVMAWESGATPVILLNKVDLSADLAGQTVAVAAIAPGVPIIPLSALQRDSLAALEPYLQSSQTAVLLGSSGVGKSTLTNQLMGKPVQATQAVRADDSRGRHTTTHRQLLVLPTGGLLIDTPGLRELQLWQAEDSLGHTFEEIEAIAADCRFRDCQHAQEPGCAVQQAIELGQLEASRLASYRKLQREQRYQQQRQDPQAQANTKARWKQITKAMRQQR